MSLRTRLLAASAPLALALVAARRRSRSRPCASLGRTSETDPRGELPQRAGRAAHEGVARAARQRGAVRRRRDARAHARRDVERALATLRARARGRGEQHHRARRGGARARAARGRWTRYRDGLRRLRRAAAAQAAAECYFAELEPRFRRAKDRQLERDPAASTRTRWCARASARGARRRAPSRRLVAAALAALVARRRGASSWLARRTVRPLAVLTQAVDAFGARRPRGARARRAAATRSRSSRPRSTPWPTASREYRAEHARRALQAQQAAQAAIDSLPDPVLVFAPDGDVLTANRAAEALLGVARGRSRSRSRPSTRRCARRSSACARTCSQGKGAYAPRGFEEAVAVAAPGRRARLPAARRAGLRGGRRRRRGRGRAPGRDAAAPLRRAARTTWSPPWRTSSARRSRRCAWRSTSASRAWPARSPRSRPTCSTPRARTASGCRRSSTSCSTWRGSRAARGARAPSRSSADALVREARRDAAARGGGARRSLLELDQCSRATTCWRIPSASQLVFTNLLANAIRHSPAGGRVRLRARAAATAVRFEVTDQGPGIPPEHRPRDLREVRPAARRAAGRRGPRPLDRRATSCARTAARSASRASRPAAAHVLVHPADREARRPRRPTQRP